MKVLKQGTPLPLVGECTGCHTVIACTTAEADAKPFPTRGGGVRNWYTVRCPTCKGSMVTVDGVPIIASDGKKYAPSED